MICLWYHRFSYMINPSDRDQPTFLNNNKDINVLKCHEFFLLSSSCTYKLHRQCWRKHASDILYAKVIHLYKYKYEYRGQNFIMLTLTLSSCIQNVFKDESCFVCSLPSLTFLFLFISLSIHIIIPAQRNWG